MAYGLIGLRHSQASAQEKRQGVVGLPENDAERLPKSGLIVRS
jgi:hypothetical protein